MSQLLPYSFLQLPNEIQQEQLVRFKGVCALYGYEGFFRLQNAHVVVIGNGGVGSWAAEALCRTGVGSLTLIDFDNIELSNSNRQLHTLSSTIGQPKSQVLADRLRDINPYIKIDVMSVLINKHNIAEHLAKALKVDLDTLNSCVVSDLDKLLAPHDLAYQKLKQCYSAVATTKSRTRMREDNGLASDDNSSGINALPGNIFVIEAIDDLFAKTSTVDFLHRAQIPFVSAGGAGGRIDPNRVKIADISNAKGDQLIKRLRTELRRNFGYPKGPEDNGKGGATEGEATTTVDETTNSAEQLASPENTRELVQAQASVEKAAETDSAEATSSETPAQNNGPIDVEALLREARYNRKMRKQLRDNEGRFNILCSYSDEKPMRASDRTQSDVDPKKWGFETAPELPPFGASMGVTATSGLLLSSVIVRWITGARV